MRLSAPLPELKRRARRLARAEGLPLHAALDRLARAEGFARWSLLVARAAQTPPRAALAEPLLARLAPGDRLLLAARPRQGKTLAALRLLLDAARQGRRAVFYTLDLTEAETRANLRRLAGSEPALADLPEIVARDDVDAGRIAAELEAGPRHAVAVVDYLQLLDQRRSTPPLARQVAELEGLARRSGATLAVLSQVDRNWAPGTSATPDLAHLRRPNPFPTEAFSHACFLHGAAMRFETLG